jgi:thiamine transporter
MKNNSVKTIAEGAVMVALSLALSYLKIPIGLAFGGFGGSIDLVMIPLIAFAVHRGLGWGLGAGLVFGTLKFFFAGGSALNWESMLLDYSVAYMFVGFAGLMRGKFAEGRGWALPVGALIGCIGRFVIHFISGVTIYAEYFEDTFLGATGLTPVTYSVLYNGTYMLPNTLLAIALCALLVKPLRAALKRLDG